MWFTFFFLQFWKDESSQSSRHSAQQHVPVQETAQRLQKCTETVSSHVSFFKENMFTDTPVGLYCKAKHTNQNELHPSYISIQDILCFGNIALMLEVNVKSH